MTPIRAEIVTDNLACVLGVTATGVLRLCEKLVHAGHDLATPLEAYRGDTLSLRVRSIGEGAWLLDRGHDHPGVDGHPGGLHASLRTRILVARRPLPKGSISGAIETRTTGISSISRPRLGQHHRPPMCRS
jgi:hypothetical protein